MCAPEAGDHAGSPLRLSLLLNTENIMSKKIDRDKAIQLARDFFELPSTQEVESAYTQEDDNVQYWWVTFAFPAEDRLWPKYDYLIARVNETTGEVELMRSI